MKKTSVMFCMMITALAALFSCSDKSTGPAALDMTVVGKWQGAIGAISLIQFKGEKIFADIYGADSSFTLITRDTTRAAAPVVKDTTLVLTGSWRLNAVKDTILLTSETCRVIDTTTNDLSPRQIQGQIIPIPVAVNKQNGTIIWKVPLTALVPLAPLIGLDLSGVPLSVLQAIVIELQKMSQ